LQNVIANDSYNSTTYSTFCVEPKPKPCILALERYDEAFSTNPKNATAKLAATPYREAAVTGSTALCAHRRIHKHSEESTESQHFTENGQTHSKCKFVKGSFVR
jgi:hypothetical protein